MLPEPEAGVDQEARVTEPASPCRLVPPTAVTNCWLAGSETTLLLACAVPSPRQLFAPESPDEFSTVWPWSAASMKVQFSVAVTVESLSSSQPP